MSDLGFPKGDVLVPRCDRYFKYIFIILRQTRQIKSLFSLKDKNLHKSHIIYEGECSCGENYAGETMRNFEVRITEHSNICHTSEPARHLLENPSHSFQWRVLCSARSYFKRKIIEGLIIQQRSPTLNKQVNCYVAQLFPNNLSIKTMQITNGLLTLMMTYLSKTFGSC